MARQAYFPGWNVVVGSGIGIAFGSVPIFASGFGMLAFAMAKQFGWTQPQVQNAASIFLLLQMLAYPLCGWPLDKWGSRAFAIASIFGFAVALVLLSQIGGSLLLFYLAFAVLSLVSAGTNVVSYARALALWFSRKRGLALGLAASGQAIGGFLVPTLAQKGIATFGWPTALLILAAFEMVICLPLVAFLVKNDPAPYGLLPDGDTAPVTPAIAPTTEADMTVGEILRTSTFWKLAVAFAVMGMSFYAIAPNIVYTLTKTASMNLAQIATIQTIAGVAVLFGRVGFGTLLDRVHAPLVGVASLLLFAASGLVYVTTPVPLLVMAGAVAMGLSIGGETDLMPYLASRYFGTRSVSKIFGWFLFAFFLGAAIGPVAFAQVMASSGSATVPLLLLVGVQIVPISLFLSLGRYPAAGTPFVAGAIAP
jgi:MFS family permease